jgi:protoheme IX farnesyltransferase
MSTVTSPPSCGTATGAAVSIRTVSPRAIVSARLADYLELTKPRIAVMALVTVTVGYTLAGAGQWEVAPLLHALFGIALVAASSSALNQLFERRTDAEMVRTANRPLPAGRLLPAEALLFGVGTGVLGAVYLALCVNPATALLALATLVLYAGVYTPLKKHTSLCTAVGAVPGALPPVLGWSAAGGELNAAAFALFAILFLWQFPHFLAIGWLYREDYRRAGLRMLPASEPAPRITGFLSVAYALCLLPASLLPRHFGLAGDGYLLAALVLGAGYNLCAVRFLANESPRTARGLLWSSLVYLPLLLLALTWDHLRLLQ